MNILIGFLTVVHVLVALFLVVLVLMQKSKDQGVGAAFGGGVTDTVFGAGTTTALVRMTIWCACIFLVTSLVLAVLHARGMGRSTSLMQRALESTPAEAPASQPPAPPRPDRPDSGALPPVDALAAPEAPADAPAPAEKPATQPE